MKRTLLSIALAVAAPASFAADSAATPPPAPKHAVDTEATRAELAQLRSQMQALSRRMAELSIELGDAGPRAYAFRYLGEPDRAILGIVLAADPKGVRISAVTPDSAAARAGLHDGDVITSINGTSLARATPDGALADARARLGDLKGGQEVRLGWQRGGTAQPELTLKAERRKAWGWAQLIGSDSEHPLPEDFEERIRADVERAQRDAERAGRQAGREAERSERARERALAMVERASGRVERKDIQGARASMPWWGLNLAPVNADLGRYFGVERGALVLATDADALPGLRAGDVITEVGGRTVARPEDALRALRDRETGSSVAIKLMRERKTVTLNVKTPAFNSIFNLPSAPPMPPPPPAPPAPVAPLAPATPMSPVVPSEPTPPAPPAPPAHPRASI